MVTLAELRSYEGKNVLVLTADESIYTGFISSVRRPRRDESRTGAVAVAHFRYKQLCKSSNGENELFRGEDLRFHFGEADAIRDIEPYEIDFIPSPTTLQ